jgi:hypothetical protein
MGIVVFPAAGTDFNHPRSYDIIVFISTRNVWGNHMLLYCVNYHHRHTNNLTNQRNDESSPFENCINMTVSMVDLIVGTLSRLLTVQKLAIFKAAVKNGMEKPDTQQAHGSAVLRDRPRQ